MSENVQAQQTYAGFWIRTLASLIDTVWVTLLVAPILTWYYGMEFWTSRVDEFRGFSFVVQLVMPAIAIIVFWLYRGASPGKMITGVEIVDALTGQKPTPRQCIVRYLGYYVSLLAFFVGFVWIAIDKQKQGWHDKLAGTIVLKKHQ